jgi:hypothetical protein
LAFQLRGKLLRQLGHRLLVEDDIRLVTVVEEVHGVALDDGHESIRVDEAAVAALYVHLLCEFRPAGADLPIDQFDVYARRCGLREEKAAQNPDDALH